MIRCSACGAEIEEGTKFCPYCGTAVTQPTAPIESAQPDVNVPAPEGYAPGQPYAGQPGAPAQQSGSYPPPEGYGSGQPYASQAGIPVAPYAAAPQGSMLPMRWHRFLLILLLFAGVLNIIGGMLQLQGYHYASEGLDPKTVYAAFPTLKIADLMYGIASIALGAFAFAVRSRLKNLCVDAPKLLITFFIATTVVSLIYRLWAFSIMGASAADPSTFSSILGCVVAVVIHSIYYSKRKHLFVN